MAPVWGQGLLDHAPVSQVVVLPVRKDLGTWGSIRNHGTWLRDGIPHDSGPHLLRAPSSNQVSSRGPRI